MELHLVHFKSNYGNVERALQFPDGVAVLAILFEVSSTDNPALAPLVNELPNIAMPGITMLCNPINPTFQYQVLQCFAIASTQH